MIILQNFFNLFKEYTINKTSKNYLNNIWKKICSYIYKNNIFCILNHHINIFKNDFSLFKNITEVNLSASI